MGTDFQFCEHYDRGGDIYSACNSCRTAWGRGYMGVSDMRLADDNDNALLRSGRNQNNHYLSGMVLNMPRILYAASRDMVIVPAAKADCLGYLEDILSRYFLLWQFCGSFQTFQLMS